MTHSLGRRAILAVYALLVIIPLLVVITGTFKTTPELFASPFGLPSSVSAKNYSAALGQGALGQAFVNSAVVTVSAVVITLFVGSLAAFGVARIPGWRGWAVYGFLVLGMAVPAQANIIPQYVLFQRLGLLDSRLGLIIIEIVAALPVAVFIMAGFLRTLPRELFEAASIDGANPWRTYSMVVLPLSRPSIAATAIFLFVIQWNDLLYPLFFIHDPSKKTLPLTLLDFQGEFLTNYPLLFSGVVVASAPLVVAYVFLQRHFVAGMTAGSLKG